MIPNSRGRIVNLGSDAGESARAGEAVYSATKGGVIAFTKTLAARGRAATASPSTACAPARPNTALLAQLGRHPTPGCSSASAKAVDPAAARRPSPRTSPEWSRSS